MNKLNPTEIENISETLAMEIIILEKDAQREIKQPSQTEMVNEISNKFEEVLKNYETKKTGNV